MNKTHVRSFAFVLLVVAVIRAGNAAAQTLSYTCKDPTGRALGILGEMGQHKLVNDNDGMKGGAITLDWNLQGDSASITIKTGVDGPPNITDGRLLFRTAEQVTFFASFPGAAYMISIFLPKRILLASSHQLFLGFDPGSSLAKTFMANCEMSVKGK